MNKNSLLNHNYICPMGADGVQYLPLLEEIGFAFLCVKEFGGVAHSVFTTPDGTRFMFPGVRGSDDETPMIPHRKLQKLLDKAKAAYNI